MFTIMGATGKVGSAVARHLLAQGHQVLLPVREPARASALVAQGATTVVAEYGRASDLAAAFRAAPAGAFVMLPPLYDPSPGFPEARARIDVLRDALAQSSPAKVVALSTIGADARPPNILTQLQLLEQALCTLPLPVTLLRAAWFLDNAAWDVQPARDRGEIDSYLQPLERAIPMVAAADVGQTVARLLQDTWQGTRIVAVQGPTPVSPLQIAAAFAEALGRPVRAAAVPRDTWSSKFTQQGMRHPEPRMRMLDGFNEGWIRFADDGGLALRGSTTLKHVIHDLVQS